MRDLAETLAAWGREGKRFALASVVDVSGSAPRGVGSAMAVREDGLIAGSVSGGCVEGAVVEAALRSLESGKPEMLEYGAESEASLWEVGLSCGGEIRVWVEPVAFGPAWDAFVEALLSGRAVTRLTCLTPSELGVAVFTAETAVGDSWLAEQVTFEAVCAKYFLVSREIEIGGVPVFGLAVPAPERLLIIGAVHIAVHLVRFASEMGMEVTVIDPREAFAREERFASLRCRLVCAWPEKALEGVAFDERTYLVTLSHDPKIDDPALFVGLRGGAGYVGALGGRKTQAKKRETLCQMGLTDEELDRIHGPIGLDLGAETPEEIALSIIAQIVTVRRTGSGR